MRIVLEVMDGPLAGKTVELSPGETVTVGRTAKSQLMLAHDSFLSGLHFLVECTEMNGVLRDCNSSNGTWINGEKVAERPIQQGDQISAGQTRFKITMDENTLSDNTRTSTVLFSIPKLDDMRMPDGSMTSVSEAKALTEEQQNVIEYLRRAPAPLYAILNGNVEERVPHILIGCGELYQYLPEGLNFGDNVPPAVYLAHVPTNSALLPKLVQEGWGKHWILFFTCMHPFAEIRKHLRQFILLQTDEGKRFFFRYYDPRLLQFFLTSCSTQEITQFFGPIQCMVMEDTFDSGKLLEFSVSPQGLSGRVQVLK